MSKEKHLKNFKPFIKVKVSQDIKDWAKAQVEKQDPKERQRFLDIINS